MRMVIGSTTLVGRCQARKEGSDEAVLTQRRISKACASSNPTPAFPQPIEGSKAKCRYLSRQRTLDLESWPLAHTRSLGYQQPGAFWPEALRAKRSPSAPHFCPALSLDRVPEKEKEEAKKEEKKRACRDQLENKRGPIPSY